MNSTKSKTSTSSPSNSVPTCPATYQRARSDLWVQRELAIAARNAKKNRSIEVPRESLDGPRNRATDVGTRPYVARTASEPTSAERVEAIYKLEQISTGSEFVPDRTTFHNIIDDWSSAVLSLFSKKESMNEETKSANPNLNMLVLL
jgi:hypothetical protein